MPKTYRSHRRSISMRRVVYDEMLTLAKRRGVSLASLLDGLAVAELAREGITVESYTPHRRKDDALKPTAAPRAFDESVPEVIDRRLPAPSDGRYIGGHWVF